MAATYCRVIAAAGKCEQLRILDLQTREASRIELHEAQAEKMYFELPKTLKVIRTNIPLFLQIVHLRRLENLEFLEVLLPLVTCLILADTKVRSHSSRLPDPSSLLAQVCGVF